MIQITYYQKRIDSSQNELQKRMHCEVLKLALKPETGKYEANRPEEKGIIRIQGRF